jgi:hypothetical protein
MTLVEMRQPGRAVANRETDLGDTPNARFRKLPP